MAQGKKRLKCYTRKGKRHVGSCKQDSTFSESYDRDSFDTSIKNKLARKRKRKKHDESSKENCGTRVAYVSKPFGIRRTSFRASSVEKKPRFSSIFNDSLPFEESPFSQLAKSVRKDLGLRFVNLNNFRSPNDFTRGKLQSSSSGCLAHSGGSSGQVLSISPESLSLLNSVPREDLCGTATQESELGPTQKLAINLFKENVSSPLLGDSLEKPVLAHRPCEGSDEVKRLSVDFVEGTPLPSPVVRKWSKTFRKRRQAMLLTSTPLYRTTFLTNSQNLSSPFQLDDQKLGSEILRNISNVSKSLSDSLPSSWKEVLRACNQNCAISFSAFVQQRTPVTLQKVGEGVFSEVFGCLDERGVRSVWKVQPFEGDLIVNGEEQKKSTEILSEIYITNSVSDLRNGIDYMTDSFVESLCFKCVHGPYPETLLQLWQEYDNEKGSENDCPSVFSEQQLMLVTELQYAGVCLEDFQFASAPQALSVFNQVAHALAVGEMALQFEHRDLHWGNIMVCKTPAKHVSFVFAGEKRTMETKGVVAKIVDFTLSRASINGHPLFADLALTPDIFESSGEYQFEIYRLMRSHTENIWSKFAPYTNVLWLHYLVLQMCKAVKYRNKKSKIHKQDMKTLVSVSSSILDYSSASDFVATQTFYPYHSELLTS